MSRHLERAKNLIEQVASSTDYFGELGEAGVNTGLAVASALVAIAEQLGGDAERKELEQRKREIRINDIADSYAGAYLAKFLPSAQMDSPAHHSLIETLVGFHHVLTEHLDD